VADACFLDVSELEYGDEFPRRLTEALLGSRVFVAFVDRTYFQRWYCLREWLLARAPHDDLLRSGAIASAVDAAVGHFVAALGVNAREAPCGGSRSAA
jgi:hypothetical protein